MVLVTMHTAVFMFHYYHSMLPKAFDNNYFIFISSTHNYNTRLASKSTYYIDHVRTNYGNRLCFYLEQLGWRDKKFISAFI